MSGSFITGKEPALLGSYDTWWFDSVETSQTRWEWESVERSCVPSRANIWRNLTNVQVRCLSRYGRPGRKSEH
jgi:hypothetical protein